MTTPVVVLERIEVLMEKHFTNIENILKQHSVSVVSEAVLFAWKQGYEQGKKESDMSDMEESV